MANEAALLDHYPRLFMVARATIRPAGGTSEDARDIVQTVCAEALASPKPIPLVLRTRSRAKNWIRAKQRMNGLLQRVRDLREYQPCPA